LRITGKVTEEMQAWQGRPLDRQVSTAVFIDAIVARGVRAGPARGIRAGPCVGGGHRCNYPRRPGGGRRAAGVVRRPLRELARDLERFFGADQRGMAAGIRVRKAAAFAVFFEFLELRLQPAIHAAAGSLGKSPLDEVNGPCGGISSRLRIPPGEREIDPQLHGEAASQPDRLLLFSPPGTRPKRTVPISDCSGKAATSRGGRCSAAAVSRRAGLGGLDQLPEVSTENAEPLSAPLRRRDRRRIQREVASSPRSWWV